MSTGVYPPLPDFPRQVPNKYAPTEGQNLVMLPGLVTEVKEEPMEVVSTLPGEEIVIDSDVSNKPNLFVT